MILSDRSLREMLKDGSLIVDPLSEESLQPASIDLRLSHRFLKVQEESQATLRLDAPPQYIAIEREELVLPPQSFLLASTMERLKLPQDLTAFVEGRSSIGRMGLFVQNAGWVDPGFEGDLTLELYNANRQPILLRAGRRICQLVFTRMDRPPIRSYQGKYQQQSGPQGSLAHLDAESQGK